MSLVQNKKAIAIFSSWENLEAAQKKLQQSRVAFHYHSQIVQNYYCLIINGSDGEIFQAKTLLTETGVERDYNLRESDNSMNLFPAIGAELPLQGNANIESAVTVLDCR